METNQNVNIESAGDEIYFHINHHAKDYIHQSPQEEQNNNQLLTIQSPMCVIPPPLEFDQIKLVSSTEVNADGHIKSVRTICSKCQKKVNTKLTRSIGCSTLLASVLLFICSFGLACISCIPCCLDDCKDIIHECPNCKKHLGKTKFNICD